MLDGGERMNNTKKSYAEMWWTLKNVLSNTFVTATSEGKSTKVISRVLELMEELEGIDAN